MQEKVKERERGKGEDRAEEREGRERGERQREI